MWAKEQVGNWLLALNMEMYIPRSLVKSIVSMIVFILRSYHHYHHKPNIVTPRHRCHHDDEFSTFENFLSRFLDSNVTGEILLNLDSTQLKQLGVVSKNDREKIKEKIKELKKQNEKEKKELEKERKKKEKAAKTASGSKAGKR